MKGDLSGRSALSRGMSAVGDDARQLPAPDQLAAGVHARFWQALYLVVGGVGGVCVVLRALRAQHDALVAAGRPAWRAVRRVRTAGAGGLGVARGRRPGLVERGPRRRDRRGGGGSGARGGGGGGA